MSDTDFGRIIRDGLWHNNQALVALLGLCPLLAVTNTAINGLGLGIATMPVWVGFGVFIMIIEYFIALLQAFIFTQLTILFVSASIHQRFGGNC